MTTRTLKIENLQAVPFSKFVEREFRKGLKALEDTKALEIDYDGKKSGDYTLTLEMKQEWFQGGNRDRCWRRPTLLGMNGTVYVGALKQWNYCRNVRDCSTCLPVFQHKESELGWAIVNTALHELGHVLGLSTKNSYAGADDGGHTGDERNFMFTYARHKAYARIQKDSKRSTKYVIREGDNLSKIANRIGFRDYGGWKILYSFKGKDGKANRDLLRSKDPDLIYPGEEIWVPDIEARIAYLRSVECRRKEFTTVQVKFMEQWIRKGKNLIEIK